MRSLKKLAVLVVCWLVTSLSANLFAQTALELSSPGTLSSSITNAGINPDDVTQLSITGVIDARDVAFMRDNLPSLAQLDLSGVTIIEYEGYEGTYTGSYSYYPANVMPMCSFFNFDMGKTSLTSVILPYGLMSIRYYAFANCTGLTSITLPAGLTSIESSAFEYCTGLTSITNLSPVPINIDYYVFNGVNKSNCELKVPTNSVNAYQEADGWKEFYTVTGGGLSFNVSVNNDALGSVTAPESGLYPVGTNITLTATPAQGYNFIEWQSGKNIFTDNPLTFDITDDIAVTAVFGNIGVHSVSPGTLKDIPEVETITNLTLTGSIDARDVKFMRDNMPYLAELDLRGVTIAEYEGSEGTYSWGYFYYLANEIPQYSFITMTGTWVKHLLLRSYFRMD
jgi:hypothetical protein